MLIGHVPLVERLVVKELASPNIWSISVTLDTFHLLSGWLKEVAPSNIADISATLDTFWNRGWLKDSAR